MNVDHDWVWDEYRAAIRTQSYGPQPSIEGVSFHEPALLSDDGGDFCEVGRFSADGAVNGFPGYHPAQISYSVMEPGCVKAWHIHQLQDDLWFVPPRSRVLVGLFDIRAESPSRGTSVRRLLGTGTPALLFIPRGVAHGVANVTGDPVTLVYFSNVGFDASNPDEHRLPFDTLGEDFWKLRAG